MPRDRPIAFEPGFDYGYFTTAALNGATHLVRHDRVRIVNHPFVYKDPRGYDQTSLEDTAGELLSVRLALGLELPAIPMVCAKYVDGGCTLVSPYREEREATSVPVEAIANLDKVHVMAVFEEWVMNADDQNRHLRASELTGGKYYVEVFDHGDTFHTWNGSFADEPAVLASPVVVQPSSGNNPYRITFWSQLEPGLNALAAVTDEYIERTVGGVVKSLNWALAGHEAAAPFMPQLAARAPVWKAILRRRRDNIRDIMNAKFPNLQMAPPPAPGTGVPA